MRGGLVIAVLLCIVAAAVALSACRVVPGAEEREEFRETYNVAAGSAVSVESFNGSIEVSGWDKGYVEVYAVKKTRYGREELDKAEIRVTLDGDLRVETVRHGTNVRVSVSYEIRLPSGVLAGELHTSNGAVEVMGVQGDADVSTSNGRITIRDVDGYVTANTSNGAIAITGAAGVRKAESSNGAIKVELRTLESDLDVTTSNGGIDLYMADGVGADLEARTSNGRISLHDIEVVSTELSGKEVKGTIGGGGPRLYAKTSNGDIDLHALD